ncbi:MAG: hypothetical protein KDD47_13740 [Acidobacteria bacterium]|nr:hypothetical protein [Acidobacteriota bacterium]
MNQDRDHLQLLSIFHYVLAAMTAFFACIPLIHFVLGLSMVFGRFPESDGDPAMRFVGSIFSILAGMMILMGWSFAVALLLAGRNLARTRRYTFCLVVAALSCAVVPFGTVLGVFTIIVLMRPSVKELFGESLKTS